MKYKLLGNNDFMFNLLETIGKNRGVENINDLININVSNLHSYKLLDNIDKAVECLIKHIDNNSKIHIVVDSDADGYASAAIIHNYLIKIYDKITWHVHPGKQHGIILEELEGKEFDLLIVPDGGSNDFEQHKFLYEQGKEIIVLDHHDFENKETQAIVVNNKACDYPNKELSGAGIVYKFCEALDNYFHVKYANDFLDLVALGNIADMMDSRSLETRYFMIKGLEKINNKFFKALIEKQSFKMSRLNIIGVSFYIAPLINAVNRIGTLEERENLFKAMTNEEIKVDYKKRGEKEIKKVFLYEDMARQSVNIKARQDKTKGKLTEKAISKINEQNLNENKILFINMGVLEETEFTGLIANDLANRYQKPVIILRRKDKTLTGSARGYEKHEIKDLKTLLDNCGWFNFAQGHEGAFGIGINPIYLSNAIKYLNDELKDVNDEVLYYIDFILNSKEVDKKLIAQFDKLIDIYGQNFKEPYLLIKGVNVNKDNVYINEKKTLLSFKDGNIKYCKFFPSDDEYGQLTKSENVDLNIIGTASINKYNNEETPQIQIVDFEIVKANNDKKFWF